ncbi:MAG: adenine phosphoribosyltransferase [Cytophagales bacterium]|nr:adenine phosphoribosyltransferase [Cytophagales bacterium]
MQISDLIKSSIRDIPDFPKEGIMFKDLTPILKDPKLCREIVLAFAEQWKDKNLDAIACLDARGFWFGLMLANELNLPLIPIRKHGKLPYKTVSYSYDLEYGSATIEMHIDAIEKGWNVLVHDDLLATGGTAAAAGELIEKMGGIVAGFAFVVHLSFLNGAEKLKKFHTELTSLVTY